MALTDVKIRAAKPREKPYKLSDGGWLYLLVTPSGSKLWRMAYRFRGKEKVLALGAYPPLSLKDARIKRDEAKALLTRDADPGEEKRLAKLAQAVATATTFELVAADYLDKLRREGRAENTIKKVEWLLSLVLPKLGKRPISQISTPEILDILKALEVRGNLETAKRLRGTAGAIFRYAIATARAENDPTSALRGAISTPKVTHRAAITDPIKLGAFLRALDAFDGQPETVAALKLLPLVFTRPGELRLAQWSEFDLDAGIWTIPAGRTKMRREHQVPLPRQALGILAKLKKLTGTGRLVFPGIRSKERPISENTLNACMRRMGFKQDEVSSHGFRATASTLLNESNQFSVDAIERALAHQDTNVVRRAYNRSAYWKERVEMARWWADYLDRLKNGGEIVPFQPTTATN